jgi:hypothetical protein
MQLSSQEMWVKPQPLKKSGRQGDPSGTPCMSAVMILYHLNMHGVNGKDWFKSR